MLEHYQFLGLPVLCVCWLVHRNPKDLSSVRKKMFLFTFAFYTLSVKSNWGSYPFPHIPLCRLALPWPLLNCLPFYCCNSRFITTKKHVFQSLLDFIPLATSLSSPCFSFVCITCCPSCLKVILTRLFY